MPFSLITTPFAHELGEALAFIEEIGPEQAWLSHISNNMGLHTERSKLLPKGVRLAWDGLVTYA